MNLLSRGAVCAPLLALMAGCCANSANNCDDLQADSLYLTLANNQLNTDTVATTFTRAELDTVYLQRFTPAKAAVPAMGTTPAVPAMAAAYSDPVSIIRPPDSTRINSMLKAKLKKNGLLDKKGIPLTTLIISNTSPFSPSTTGGKLNAYNYLLTVQDKSVKPRRTYLFEIDNIQLQGQYNADGCNTCYQNTYKSFRVNNSVPNRDVTEQSGAPVVITLTKKEAK